MSDSRIPNSRQPGGFNFGNTSPQVLVASQLKLRRSTAECSASLSGPKAYVSKLIRSASSATI